MNVEQTEIPGVLIIQPKVFGDQRGFFLETFEKNRYASHGITMPFVQDNLSRSQKNVLRGLHYQLEKPQGKLVYVTRGSVLDIAVDIRKNSPSFGKHIAVILSDENHKQLYIPPGCAHGFCVLSDVADFFYQCTDYYHPSSEKGILWNDPALNIQWNIANPILSEKDQKYPLLKDIPESQLPGYST